MDTPTVETTAPPVKPANADRLAAYGAAPATRRVRTLVACIAADDAGDLEDAVNGELRLIEGQGGTVVDVKYAAAAVMAPDSLVVEDRLSALILCRLVDRS